MRDLWRDGIRELPARDAELLKHVHDAAKRAVAPTQCAVRQESSPVSVVTVPEAAARLGVSQQAIRARIARGSLPATKHGRIWLINEEHLSDHGR